MPDGAAMRIGSGALVAPGVVACGVQGAIEAPCAAERSALASRVSAARSGPANCGSVVVLLPPPPGTGERLLDAIRDAGWLGKVITLQPPRAVYTREEVRGFTWYHSFDSHAIEPSSFGDSLWHLERFVLDLLQSESAPDRVMLVGAEEGATLALAAVPYLHDRIAAVVAINGAFPAESWWDPPSPAMQGFPVWLIQGGEAARRRTDSLPWLTELGARVEISGGEHVDPLRALGGGLSNWLQKNGLVEPRGIHA